MLPHLLRDVSAFGYVLPTTGRTPDLHRLETCTAGRTIKKDISDRYSIRNVFEISRIYTGDILFPLQPVQCAFLLKPRKIILPQRLVEHNGRRIAQVQ